MWNPNFGSSDRNWTPCKMTTSEFNYSSVSTPYKCLDFKGILKKMEWKIERKYQKAFRYVERKYSGKYACWEKTSLKVHNKY